jgi:threonine dehydrogenase-like Zn-dependent dehydrogenase
MAFVWQNHRLVNALAVIGLGLLGLLTMNIARAAGCHSLGIDLDPERVRLANEMGFHAVLRDQAVDETQSIFQMVKVVMLC